VSQLRSLVLIMQRCGYKNTARYLCAESVKSLAAGRWRASPRRFSLPMPHTTAAASARPNCVVLHSSEKLLQHCIVSLKTEYIHYRMRYNIIRDGEISLHKLLATAQSSNRMDGGTKEKLMDINQLFESNNVAQQVTNSRGLAGTAQLTNLSTEITNVVLKSLDANFADHKDLIAKSKTDHNAMDELVGLMYPIATEDVSFLKALDEATLEGMLKSQQSKRSRSKSKVMTMDNYANMMVGAVAENLVRLALGKSKLASGANRATGTIEFSEELLQELQDDQDRLRKELRNVQSKKSIMKGKADFSETDERWVSLLKAEAQLKAIRVGAATTIVEVEVDTTRELIADLFLGINIEGLKSQDSKQLLEQIKEIIMAD